MKKMFGFRATTLVFSNKEMHDIIKIVKSLEESGLLIKGVSKTFKNEAKEQKGEFLGMLIDTLSAILLRNLLPMDKSSSIRHRFDVEIPRGKFVKMISILKGKSTWKLGH